MSWYCNRAFVALCSTSIFFLFFSRTWWPKKPILDNLIMCFFICFLTIFRIICVRIQVNHMDIWLKILVTDAFMQLSANYHAVTEFELCKAPCFLRMILVYRLLKSGGSFQYIYDKCWCLPLSGHRVWWEWKLELDNCRCHVWYLKAS